MNQLKYHILAATAEVRFPDISFPWIQGISICMACGMEMPQWESRVGARYLCRPTVSLRDHQWRFAREESPRHLVMSRCFIANQPGNRPNLVEGSGISIYSAVLAANSRWRALADILWGVVL